MCLVITSPGILYGNPKVRLILLVINILKYLLAKYLNPISSLLFTKEYTAHNPSDFAKEAVNFDLNFYMAGLDVELLFTIILLEETIEKCVNNSLFKNFYSDN